MYVCICMFVSDLALVFVTVGLHGGARDASRAFSNADQDIIEFHAWQILKHDPR